MLYDQMPVVEIADDDAAEEQDKQATGYETDVDLVYVIDGTGSMQNLLDNVRDTATTLDRRINKALPSYKRFIRNLRIRVIVYRDIYVDSQWIQDSGFMNLPEDREEFRSFVENIKASGGGDIPESGLEALHAALQSDWNNTPGAIKHRQIVVVMTDAPAHPLDHPQRKIDPGYPNDFEVPIPDTLAKLREEWVKIKSDPTLSQGARLLLFAPNDDPWQKVSQWPVSNLHSIVGGKGISEEIYEEIIRFIAKSV